MIGFLIKKNFFDLWDNLFKAALLNIGFMASLAFPVFIPPLLEELPPAGPLGMSLPGAVVLGVGILWCFIYLAAAGLSLKNISDNRSFGFADFFANLKAAWPAGAALGGIVFFLFVPLVMAILFYLGMGSLLGLFLAAFVFWALVIGVLSLQFFYAVRSRLDVKFFKIIKKCFIIFFDNPGFSVFCFFYNLASLVLSALLAFIFPGPAGLLLFTDEALRLRLLKYDYLEANPEAPRRKIPWDVLLIEERERTGTRSLKSFIFPWKD
jgi:hypothetical protein